VSPSVYQNCVETRSQRKGCQAGDVALFCMTISFSLSAFCEVLQGCFPCGPCNGHVIQSTKLRTTIAVRLWRELGCLPSPEQSCTMIVPDGIRAGNLTWGTVGRMRTFNTNREGM